MTNFTGLQGARWFQHRQIDMCNSSHKYMQKQRSHDHLGCFRKRFQESSILHDEGYKEMPLRDSLWQTPYKHYNK